VKLVDAGNLKLSFEQSNYAVQTISLPFRTHDVGVVSLAATVAGRKIKKPFDEIEEMFEREFGKSASLKPRFRCVSTSRISKPNSMTFGRSPNSTLVTTPTVTSQANCWAPRF
jgi:hypothetical protein